MNEKEQEIGEIHPAALDALDFVKQFMVLQPYEFFRIRESFASNALEGNKLATSCLSTITRLENNKGVGPQYILGLAWYILKFTYPEGFAINKELPK